MDAVRIVVLGKVPRKNGRTRTRIVVPKSGRDPFVHYHPSKDWEDWIARLSMEVTGLAKIDRGAWSIEIHHYTERTRHLDGETLHVADGDVDSATSAVLDGLQAVGILDDDARFIRESAEKFVDKSNPRTEITLTRVDAAQLDLTATITPTPARARATKKRAPKTPKPTDPRNLDDF